MKHLWLAPSVALLAAAAPGQGTGPGAAALQELRFVPNSGQWVPAVAFAAFGGRGDAWLLRDGFACRWQRRSPPASEPGRETAGTVGAVVRAVFEGCGKAAIRGEDRLPGRHHFLRGADPAGWATSLPAFRRVRYRGLYPGIDLLVRPLPAAGQNGLFEYDLELAPGTDLGAVTVRLDGVERLSLAEDGSLVAHLQDGSGRPFELHQLSPRAFQRGGGGLQPLACRFVLLGARRFGFEVDGADAEAGLLVDPGIVWSTFLGGGSSDAANAVRWLPGTGVFAAGFAGSSDFPVTTGAFQSQGQRDAFVARLSEDGTQLVYATYLGGSDGEEVRGLDVDPGGNVTVVGWTTSTDFPVTASALQGTNRGGSVILATGDAFITRLRADGAALLGSTFLGGTLDEVAEAVAVDALGTATVVGWTASLDFPVTPGALQGSIGSPLQLRPDGFVARVSPDGRSAAFATYLGGFLRDELHAVKLGAGGEITVAGFSESVDYPISIGAFRTTLAGSHDAVVTRLNAQGNAVLWSTFLGGGGHDRALALELLADGSPVLGGNTGSTNFPASNGAVQTALNGFTDGFLARLRPDGTALTWATYLGGSGEDVVRAVAADGNGGVLAVGETQGGFPTTATAPQAAFGGGVFDAFLSRVDQNGTVLGFSTYLGGSQDEVLAAVTENAGLAVVGGWTWSPDWPATPGTVQPVSRGSIEACLAQIDLLNRLEGVVNVGGGDLVAAEFAAGTAFAALDLRIDNGTNRPVMLRRLRCFLGGTGDNPRDLSAIRVYWDRDADGAIGAADLLVAGPESPVADNSGVELAVSGLTVDPGGREQLLVQLQSRPGCAAGAEFACSVTGLDAWQFQALGAGAGPSLVLGGSDFVQGPAMACGSRLGFSGDANGDGLQDARDLRALAFRLGQAAAGADPDGDGTTTAADLALLQDRILGRPVLLAVPSSLQRGDDLTLSGFGLAGSVVATLGGRVLPRLSVTSRELVLATDAALPTGNQTLVLDIDGRRVLQQTIAVR